MTIRGIMVAFIEYDVPHLFTQIAADGSQFKCSESYVRNSLCTLGWSERCATRAAQKLFANYEQTLSDSFLCQAFIIHDHGIPVPLHVNTDQTQMHYQIGRKRTWNKKGQSRLQPWEWMRNKLSHWSLQSLLAANCSQYKPSSMARQPLHVLAHEPTTIQRLTREGLNLSLC